MKTFRIMLKTEFKLSLRGMDMVIFAIGLPVVVTVILGLLYGAKPAFAGAGYTFFEQSFGAVSTIAVCAGGVMGLPLVISDYRHKKILKRFQVTPVSPAMLLLVQVTIYFIYCIASIVCVYLVSLLFGSSLQGGLLSFTGAYLLVILSIFSIGMMVAAVSPNMKTTNVLCSVLYFPMLIFSGATLPYEVMPPILQRISDFMPLTQGIKLLKSTSLGLPLTSTLLPIIVMTAISLVCIGISIKCFKWE